MQPLDLAIQGLKTLLPEGGQAEQNLRRKIYQYLMKGQPLSEKQLADGLQYSMSQLELAITKLQYLEYNQQDEIIAFRGLTLKPSKHKVEIQDSRFYTWCAFDSLFLAELAKQDTVITSHCPSCEKSIRFSIVAGANAAGAKGFSSEQLTQLDQSPLRMSFIIPNMEKYRLGLQASFCCKIHFFCDEKCASIWQGQEPEVQFFKLGDAMKIATRRNEIFLGIDS